MSKIPEGATHKNAYGFFRKFQAGIWYSYADGDWIRFIDAEPETYIPIQAEQEWSGEGLPPVGLVCEHSCDDNKTDSSDGGWKEVKIVGHHQFLNDEYLCAVWVSGTEVSYSSEGEHFRPIRTPEQIAAEKRDAAIKEMQRLVGSCNTFPFAELYDYGYRLQVTE